MFTIISTPLRSLVAYISLGNLKDYLKKAVAVLPPENLLKPIIVKEILDKNNPQNIKETLQSLKEIIKGYDPANRKPFQKIILEPIQSYINNQLFNSKELMETIKDMKEDLQKSEKELSQARKQIQEDKTIPFPKVLTGSPLY